MDRVRNEEVHRRAGLERDLGSTVDQRVLRCGIVDHVEKMYEYRMARRVRGRPRLSWMDGVKVVWGSRGMTLEALR